MEFISESLVALAASVPAAGPLSRRFGSETFPKLLQSVRNDRMNSLDISEIHCLYGGYLLLIVRVHPPPSAAKRHSLLIQQHIALLIIVQLSLLTDERRKKKQGKI